MVAAGDKSTLVETTDGGATWQARKIAQSREGVSEDIALAVQDPIFYDIEFAVGLTVVTSAATDITVSYT